MGAGAWARRFGAMGWSWRLSVVCGTKRREAGAAQEQPLPGAPDTVTFDAGALTLSVPALPEHATSLRAFRKAAGGEPELAGTATGTTVSVVGSGPLTPGVTYELWVVGHNFRGDGPESNRVNHTA